MKRVRLGSMFVALAAASVLAVMTGAGTALAQTSERDRRCWRRFTTRQAE